MNNFYSTSDMSYTETAITLEDFTYGEKTKITIPVLLPLLDNTQPMESTKYLNRRNIINKNRDDIQVTKCTKCNYIELVIPKDLCPCLGIDPKCNHKGKKGQKFIVNFIGADINKPVIYRRYE